MSLNDTDPQKRTQHVVAAGDAYLDDVVTHHGAHLDALGFSDGLVRAHQLAFHGVGIATGLEVSIVTDGAGKKLARVSPGIAADTSGKHIWLRVHGSCETHPDASPAQTRSLPVTATGVDFAIPETDGTFVLTAQHYERELDDAGLAVVQQTPWLRWLSATTLDAGCVVLASLTVTNHSVSSLKAGARVSTSTTTGGVSLTAPTPTPNSVAERVAGRLAALGNGVALTATVPDGVIRLGGEDPAHPPTVTLDGNTDLRGTLAIQGKESMRGNDAWLRLNHTSAFASGVLTLGNLASGRLNVGGVNGWGDPGPGNMWVAGNTTISGAAAIGGDIAIAGKHAFRGSDAWLRLNQDGAFSAGVHTPGNLAPGRLNVGGVNGWGDPGQGNAWIAGAMRLGGDLAIAGKHAFRGNDTWLRLNQDGAFGSGVHTPGNFAPGRLNVGGVNGWGDPGDGNVWIAGNVSIGGDTAIGHYVALGGKHAFRGDDGWLRLNQDGAFGAGVHTPGNFAPGRLNIGGVGGWGDPGPGNMWIAGDLTLEAGRTISSRGRMHIHGSELLFLLNTSGVQISKAWGGNGNLVVEGEMTVGGSFLYVSGAAGEATYIGGDGASNDVQIGSTNGGVTTVSAWNWASGWMTMRAKNFASASDLRYKEAIEPVHGALEKIMRLRGVSFKWKAEPHDVVSRQRSAKAHPKPSEFSRAVPAPPAVSSELSAPFLPSDSDAATPPMAVSPPQPVTTSSSTPAEPRSSSSPVVPAAAPPSAATKQFGLIAQEVMDVVPEAVVEHHGGSLAITFNAITALLVEAVKEQQAQIRLLQSRITSLEGRSQKA